MIEIIKTYNTIDKALKYRQYYIEKILSKNQVLIYEHIQPRKQHICCMVNTPPIILYKLVIKYEVN